MKVFMLTLLQVTALREATLPSRPWPIPRPPGPGLRAEHGSPGTARTPAWLQHKLPRAGRRPVAAGESPGREDLLAANALAGWSAALYNLTRGRGPTRAEAGPPFQPEVLPTCTGEERRGLAPPGAGRGAALCG